MIEIIEKIQSTKLRILSKSCSRTGEKSYSDRTSKTRILNDWGKKLTNDRTGRQ